MADEKLSQSEINALFQAVDEGQDVEELQAADDKYSYKTYDFDRPEKFSVENLSSIRSIAQAFGKSFSQSLTAKLRTPTTVEFSTIEQMPFTVEYADKMVKDYYAFAVVDMGHQELGEIVVELDLSFLLNVHRRWLGGILPEELPERRPPTDIEVITLRKLLKNSLLKDLKEAFSAIEVIEPKFVKYETDPQSLRITSTTDMISLVTLNIATKNWKTTMRLVIPFLNIEYIIDKLTAENVREFQPKTKKKKFRKEIEKGLENVEKEVYISIGSTKLSLSELCEFEVGDILRLDNKISEPVKGYAGGLHKFDAHIGRMRNNKAFRFVDFVDGKGAGDEKSSEVPEDTKDE